MTKTDREALAAGRDREALAAGRDRVERAAGEMLAALEVAEEALRTSYDVMCYPATADCPQQIALDVVRAAIAAARGATVAEGAKGGADVEIEQPER